MELTNAVEATELYGNEVSQELYIVLGFDPGGTTGWCVMGVHPDAVASGDPEIRIMDNVEFWSAGEFIGTEHSQCDQIVDMVNCWPSARLVSEQFILRSNVRGGEVFSLERMNAIISWAVRPRYFVLQQPSLAMTTITDQRQRDMGLWIPGKEHARDATKHVLTFLRRQRDRHLKAAATVRNAH